RPGSPRLLLRRAGLDVERPPEANQRRGGHTPRVQPTQGARISPVQYEPSPLSSRTRIHLAHRESDPTRAECLSRSAIGIRLEARGRQPVVEELEVRLVPSAGPRGFTIHQAHRSVAAPCEMGHPISRPATHEAPGLRARLAGPIDSSGKVIVI